MEDEEISYNAFYLLLKNKYRNKHDEAISKCCTICIPCNNSLRGVTITTEFIDDHILKQDPDNQQHFISLNGDTYYLKNNKFQLKTETNHNSTTHGINILFYEQSFNRTYGRYSILILDKPLKPTCIYNNQIIENDVRLNQNIFNYKDALKFLDEVSAESSLLELKIELTDMNVRQFNSAEELREKLKDLSCQYWAKTMRSNSLELQRDARFQSLLSKALEIFVMHFLHQPIYSTMLQTLNTEDNFVTTKLDALHQLNISLDQLNFVETEINVELPLAIAELSRLNYSEGPWEKFVCLRNCLDLMVAEYKAIYADIKTANNDNDKDDGDMIIDTRRNITAVLSEDSLVKLLVYVIVMSKPVRLITDLHYIQNFLWSVTPADRFSYTLSVFKASLSVIYKISTNNLPKWQISEIKKQFILKDIMKLANLESLSLRG